MSPLGTAAYDGLTDLPPLVERAVDLARRLGFANSCRPEHGRLLRALAAGAGTIGETGTGCGVGLAWLASGARPGTRLVSVEVDTERAGLVASLLIKPGGTMVIDDLTPASTWPPRFDGQVDQARMYWLTHPALDAAELRLAPDLAALVATRRFPAS
jgi:hypothetical protein